MLHPAISRGRRRERPRAQDGTMVTPNGVILRGSNISIGLRAQPTPPITQLSAHLSFRQTGANYVRSAVLLSQASMTLEDQLPRLDAAVDAAGRAGNILMINNSLSPGSYSVTELQQFWTAVAPRYKHHKHLIYEMPNEPVKGAPWGSATSWNDSVLNDLLGVYTIMRTAAPDTPIVVFNSANIAPNAKAWAARPIARWETLGNPLNPDRDIVGYHYYAGTLDCSVSGPAAATDGGVAALSYIKGLGHTMMLTETNKWHDDILNYPPSDQAHMANALRYHEDLGLSWMYIDTATDWSRLVSNINELHSQGYDW